MCLWAWVAISDPWCQTTLQSLATLHRAHACVFDHLYVQVCVCIVSIKGGLDLLDKIHVYFSDYLSVCFGSSGS